MPDGKIKPGGYNSETGGVEPINLGGRLVDPLERVRGMTPEERAYRKQFLKDQALSPNEPRVVPEMYLELINPIRRFYRKPLDMLFEKLNLDPKIGAENAHLLRYGTGRFLLTLGFVYVTTYYFMYNAGDWTTAGKWHIYRARTPVLPGHPEYPKLSERKEYKDYYDQGFKNSPI